MKELIDNIHNNDKLMTNVRVTDLFMFGSTGIKISELFGRMDRMLKRYMGLRESFITSFNVGGGDLISLLRDMFGGSTNMYGLIRYEYLNSVIIGGNPGFISGSTVSLTSVLTDNVFGINNTPFINVQQPTSEDILKTFGW